MGLDANKNVVLTFMELVDAGRYDEIDALVAGDFINHAGGGARGVEAWKAIFKAIVARFLTRATRLMTSSPKVTRWLWLPPCAARTGPRPFRP